MDLKKFVKDLKLLKIKLTRKKINKLKKSEIENIFGAIEQSEKQYLDIKSFFNDDLIVISYKRLHMFIFYSTMIDNYNIFSNVPARIYDKNISASVVKNKLIEMILKTNMEDINNNIIVDSNYLTKLIKTLNLIYSTLKYNKVISHGMKYKINDSDNSIRAICIRNTSESEEIIKYIIDDNDISYYLRDGTLIKFNDIIK